MNHKKTIAKASSLVSTNKESLFDSMILVDFWNKVTKMDDVELIRKVHKIFQKILVDCMQHWRGDSLFQTCLDKGLLPLDDPTKQVGDIVVFGEVVGVVKKIEGKIFVVHTTDGQDLPFTTIED